jgi:hypothetical protein
METLSQRLECRAGVGCGHNKKTEPQRQGPVVCAKAKNLPLERFIQTAQITSVPPLDFGYSASQAISDDEQKVHSFGQEQNG